MKQLQSDDPEIQGLLALMLLHDARRQARHNSAGDLITLEVQDRSLWDQDQIDRGRTLLIGALARGGIGPYQVQAAISAVHADAVDFDSTDWQEICLLYQKLYALQPSPIVALNGAVARSFVDGPSAGLSELETLNSAKSLGRYQPYHVARADMLRRTGDRSSAHAAYQFALDLTDNSSERKFLEDRLAETA